MPMQAQLPVRSLAPLFLFAAVIGCAAKAAPVDTAAIKQALIARSDSLTAAEAAKDSAKAVTYFAEDVIIQPANMPAMKGKADVEKIYGMFLPMIDVFEGVRTDMIVSSSGDMAWEYGVNKMTMKGAKAPTMGKFLATWKKVGDQWLVASLAFSDDQPPPPEPTPTGKAK